MIPAAQISHAASSDLCPQSEFQQIINPIAQKQSAKVAWIDATRILLPSYPGEGRFHLVASETAQLQVYTPFT